MGEANLIRPVSVEDMRSMMDSFDTNVSDLRTWMVHVHGAVRELTGVIHKVPLSTGGTANASHVGTSDSPGRLTIKIPPRTAALAGVSRNARNRSVTGYRPPTIARSSQPLSRPAHTVTESSAESSESDLQETSGASSTASRHTPPMASKSSHNAGAQGANSLRGLPTPGLVIPDIPVRNPDGSRRPKSESWRDIVKHWTEGDPSVGLHTPLKDWPANWTRGNNWVFATKHQQRSLIALEFIERSVWPLIPPADDVRSSSPALSCRRFQSDEARFLAAYPEAIHGHCALMRAIDSDAAREARGEREVRSWRGLKPQES